MKIIRMAKTDAEMDAEMEDLVGRLLTPVEMDLVAGGPEHSQSGQPFTQGAGCNYGQASGNGPYNQTCGNHP